MQINGGENIFEINIQFIMEEARTCVGRKLLLCARGVQVISAYIGEVRKLKSAWVIYSPWACRFENLWIIIASRVADQLCFRREN